MKKIKNLTMLQRSVVACFILMFIISAAVAQRTQEPVLINIGSFMKGYLKSLPAEYSSNPNKRYPMIVFLHGSGQKGNGDSAGFSNLKNGPGIPGLITNGQFPEVFTEDGKEYSFIVVSPQTTTTGQTGLPNSADLNKFIDTCISRYRVDTSRIYITGLSMGGGNTIFYCGNYPNKVAAAVTTAGTATFNPIVEGYCNNIAQSNLPFWATNNIGDSTAKLRLHSRPWIEAINDTVPAPDPLARLTVFNANGHEGWTTTYSPSFRDSTGRNIYEWMLQYSNHKLTAHAGKDTVLPSAITTVVLDGRRSMARRGRITAYEWLKLSGPANDTIASPANDTTVLRGLTNGVYAFQLKITHTDGTIARDTIVVTANVSNVQTQTAVNPSPAVYSTIGGFYQSLPLSYHSDTSKKFPLILFLHGSTEIGNGTTDLPNIAIYGPPKLLKDGNFPSTISSNGIPYSFIVLSPQLSTTTNFSQAITAMINYAVTNYRVDTSRIYLTGVNAGGNMAWLHVGAQQNLADRIAAMLLTAPSVGVPYAARAAVVAASKLPIWTTSNYADPSPPRNAVKLMTDTINLNGINPPAKFSILDSANTNVNVNDSWTETYDTSFRRDGLNVFEWMLQHTNNKLKADAGTDKTIASPVKTVTLSGKKSIARNSVITSYLWTKLYGPEKDTIVSPSADTTIINGLRGGSYAYQLKITSSTGAFSFDTVLITSTVQTQHAKNPSPAAYYTIGGFYESLPISYHKDSTKKYPLIVSLHGGAEIGNGTTDLPNITVFGPPQLLNNGNFPASVYSGGQPYSFIVVSPQFNTTTNVVPAIKAMIDYATINYRVDTNRIYITGINGGGNFAWLHAGSDQNYARRIAAMLLTAPSLGSPLSTRPATVAAADLPIWITSNYGDPSPPRNTVKLTVDTINLYNPSPLAKYSILDTAGTNPNVNDSWTQTYDSSFRRDGLNALEWLLSHSRLGYSPRKMAVSNSEDLPLNNSALDSELKVTLNPNPVRSNLTVFVSGKATGNASLALYNLQGQKVSQQQFNKPSAQTVSRNVQVSNLPSGAYAIQVVLAGKTKVIQFIKE